jgi:hypothetical protein
MDSSAADKTNQFDRLAFLERGLRKILPLDNLPVDFRDYSGLVDPKTVQKMGYAGRPAAVGEFPFGTVNSYNSAHSAPFEETGAL